MPARRKEPLSAKAVYKRTDSGCPERAENVEDAAAPAASYYVIF